MKELKDMTAAELVAKHELLTYQVRTLETIYETTESDLSDFVVIENLKEELAAYTAELDARCDKWELSISDGGGIVFYDSKHIKIYISHDIGDSVTIRDAAEFHALLGYLLSKEVKP